MKNLAIIGWPKSKTHTRTHQACLWAFPPHVSETLLLYLGIIRPVSIKLCNALGQQPRHSLDTHIFVSNSPPKPGDKDGWSPEFTTMVLRTLSTKHSDISLPLDSARLRQIMTAIFRKHFPRLALTPSKATSYVDMQGDHTGTTSDRNYGIHLGPVTGLHISDTAVDVYLEISQVWHATLGLMPVNHHFVESLQKLEMYRINVNKITALNHTRWLVCHDYGLGGNLTPEAAICKAESIFRARPFLIHRVTEHSIGDGVLVRTCSILLFGDMTRPSIEYPPIGGYSPGVLAEAVVIILFALEEWSSGKPVPGDMQDPSLALPLQEACSKLTQYFQQIKTADPTGWNNLSNSIHCAPLERAQKLNHHLTFLGGDLGL
ncbi:hypothetical protein BD779DRAFT_1678632 [Infundibulicybe gibba]|nr:hypothetical protein BD779DRAFT_1678632 [Infundibulicybe gibba]